MATSEAWYQNVPKLVEETDKLYQINPILQQMGGKWQVAQDKIVKLRNWSDSETFWSDSFKRILERNNIFYVPKAMSPGPCVVFPLRDFDALPVRAQTKPLEGSVLEGKSKYMWIGLKSYGPSWLGDSAEILQKILITHSVILVEGPFDWLAAQLVAPDLPILCALTKRIGGSHEAYLRMLGVKNLYLMFDQDRPAEGKDIGQGQLSMLSLRKQITTMDVRILTCPTQDPSKALETRRTARQLRETLLGVFEQPRTYSSKLLV